MKLFYVSVLTFTLLACSSSSDDQETTPNVIENKSDKITFDFDETKVLDYDVEYGNDISYAGNSRATIRVMLNVSEIPSDEEITMTSYKIFQENTKGWNEVTIWSYLPEMNMESSAYGIFEINTNGKVKFFHNDAGLIGTKWYKEK